MGLSEHQISRRDLIKKSAVAGAIIWSAPVIESVTSRAAAQSATCSATAFNASWIYIVYTYTDSAGAIVTSYIGFTLNSSTGTGTCTPAANPHEDKSTGVCTTGYYYTILTTGKGVQPPAVVTETNGSGTTTPLPYGADGGCSLFTLTGSTVTSNSASVQIVAAFCFGASNLTAVCVANTSGGCFANCG
jgi:hypothetical protein